VGKKMSILAKWLSKRKGTDIPFAIIDTVKTLWPDDPPVLIRNSKTDKGYEMVYVMPRNMSFDDFKRKEGNFRAATGCRITFKEDGKSLVMQIFEAKLPCRIDYGWDPTKYPKMHLPVPLGVDINGVFVVDLVELPHLFMSGPTGTGKSMITRSVATSLQVGSAGRMFMVVVDYGEVDYLWLEDRALLVTDVDKANEVFTLLNREMDRRKKLLVKNRVEKVTKLKEQIPFIVVLIDEFAEINQDEASIKMVDRLLRVGRKTGIHIVAATQRLSHTTVKGAGDIKHNFPARLSFRCDAVNSRMVLGDDCDLASRLPEDKGRCVFRFGDPVELQTFLIEPEKAEKLIMQLPRNEVFHIDESPALLPPR
jgi:S-DNA-T family DNA segregation ATPase FtsK/SpoIIIE